MRHPDFMRAYELWAAEPFPAGSKDDELDEIHVQLAYADAMAADVLVPLAKGALSPGSFPDQARKELRDVLVRSANLESVGGPKGRPAASYRRYAELLLKVLAEIP